MTPSTQMGMRNPEEQTSAMPNHLYNSISSQGVAPANSLEQSQQPVEQSPAEQFLSEFSQAFNSIKSLLDNSNYAMAQKEGELVKKSLENYMEAVVTGLSVQAGMGGESFGGGQY